MWFAVPDVTDVYYWRQARRTRDGAESEGLLMRHTARVIFVGATLVAAVLTAQAALGSAVASAPPYRADGTVTVEWSTGPQNPSKGKAVYAISGPLLTNAQRQAYAPVVVPSKFSFKPAAPGYPGYLRASLRSVSFTSSETIEGCGDGSETRLRTATVERITDQRAIFDQSSAITLNRLGGRSVLEIGAITLYIVRDGVQLGNYTNYSNMGEVETRLTGGCPEVFAGGPGTYRVQMHQLMGEAMRQLVHLAVTGRRTANGTFSFRGVNSSPDVDPSPSSRVSVKVTIDARINGPDNARGVFCAYPTPTQLAPARSAAQAQTILHRAGIYGALYRGEKRNLSVPAGHYFVDTSSPFWPCNTPGSDLVRATR